MTVFSKLAFNHGRWQVSHVKQDMAKCFARLSIINFINYAYDIYVLIIERFRFYAYDTVNAAVTRETISGISGSGNPAIVRAV